MFTNIVCIVICMVYLYLRQRNLMFYVFINRASDENKKKDPSVKNYKIIQLITFYEICIVVNTI